MSQVQGHPHWGWNKASAAKVLDFIQTAWILDPSMFALDYYNDNHLTLALVQKQF